jgi:hypothetical protein
MPKLALKELARRRRDRTDSFCDYCKAFRSTAPAPRSRVRGSLRTLAERRPVATTSAAPAETLIEGALEELTSDVRNAARWTLEVACADPIPLQCPFGSGDYLLE